MAVTPRCELSAAVNAAAVSPALTGWTNAGLGVSGTAPATGDFVIIIITSNTASDTLNQTAGTRWTPLDGTGTNLGAAVGMTTSILFKIWDGTETAPTFTWTTSVRNSYAVMALAPDAGNQIYSDVWSAIKKDTTAATTHTPNSVTIPAGFTDCVLTLAGAVNSASGSASALTWTASTSYAIPSGASVSNTGTTAQNVYGSAIQYQRSLTGTQSPAAEGIAQGATTTYAQLQTVAIRQIPLTTAPFQVLQTAYGVNAASVTLASPTSMGSSALIVIASLANTVATVAPSISAITLGGSADHFAAAKEVSVLGSTFSLANAYYAGIWVDRDCAGGQTAVAATIANNASNASCGLIVMEVAGIAPSAPVDKTISATGNSTAANSGATATTATAVQFLVGAVAGGAGNNSLSGPGPAGNIGLGLSALLEGGAYSVITAATTATFSAALKSSYCWAAAAVTLLSGTAAHPATLATSASFPAVTVNAGSSVAASGTVLQAAVPVHLTSLTGPVSVTMPQPTAAGASTLIACIGTNGSVTANPVTSGITLGGSADHWAKVTQLASASRNDTEIWYDPGCAAGQTAVAVTCSGGGGTGDLYVTVYEVAGVLTADQVHTLEAGPATTWSSGATPTTTRAAEIFFGAAMIGNSQNPAVTGAGAWTSQNSVVTATFCLAAGYQNVTSAGTATFSGTTGATANSTVAVATFVPPPTGPAGTASFPAVTVNAGSRAAPAVLAVSASFAAPAIQAGVQFTPAVLATSASFPAVTITVGTNATAAPAVLATSASFAAPAIRADAIVSLTGWSYAASGTPVDGTYFILSQAQVSASGVAAGQVVSDTANPGVLFTITAVGAPFAGFQNVSITPVAVTAMNSPDPVTQVIAVPGAARFTAPSVRADQKVTAPVLATPAGFPVPAIRADEKVTPALLAVSASFSAPAIRADSQVTVFLAASSAFPAATANAGSGVTTVLLAGTTAFAAPGVDRITPVALATAASFTAPAIDQVQPAVLAVAASFAAPAANAGSGVTPGALATPASFPAVTIAAGTGATAAPGVLAVQAAFAASQVSTGSVVVLGIAAPSLVQYANTSWNSTGTKSTPAITWQAGDVIIVLQASSVASIGAPGAPTAAGLSFSAISGALAGGGSFSYAFANAFIATPGSGGSAAVAATGSTNNWGQGAWVWRGCNGAGAVAAAWDATLTASLARTGASSAVLGGVFDWNAGSPAGYGWTPVPTTDRQHAQSASQWTYYVADWANQGTVGTTSYGLTGSLGSGPFTRLFVEALGSTTAPSVAASASFPVAAVSAGSVVTPAALAVSASFPAPQVSAGSIAVPAVLAASVSFPASGVSAGGNATATPAALAASASFPAAGISTGTVVIPAVLAVPVSFAAPQANAGTGIAPPVLAVAAAFAAPVIRADAIVAQAALAGSVSFPARTLRADAITAPAVLAVAASFSAPSLRADQAAAPALLAVSTSFLAAANAGSGTTTPVLAVSAAFPALTVRAGSVVTTSLLAATAAFPARTVAAGAGVTLSLLAAQASFAVPSLQADAVVTPALLAASASFPAPGVSAGGNATAIPPLLAAPASFPAPAIGIGSAVTATALATSASFPAVTVSAGSGVTPALLAASASFPARTMRCDQAATPAALAVSAAFTATALHCGETAAPANLAGSAAFAAPSLHTGAVAVLAPLAAAASFGAPSVTAQSGITVTPVALAAQASFPAPAVSTSAGITVTPAALATSASFPARAVAAGSAVVPAALAVQASFPAPALAAGSRVTPGVLAVFAIFPAPAVSTSTGTTVLPAALLTGTVFPARSIGAGAGAQPAGLILAAVFPAPSASTGSVVTPAALAALAAFPPLAVGRPVLAVIALTASCSMRVHAASGPDIDALWNAYAIAAAEAQAAHDYWMELRIAGAQAGMAGNAYADLWTKDGEAQRLWHDWLMASEHWSRELAQFAQYGSTPPPGEFAVDALDA